jgi:hypothetical protein
VREAVKLVHRKALDAFQALKQKEDEYYSHIDARAASKLVVNKEVRDGACMGSARSVVMDGACYMWDGVDQGSKPYDHSVRLACHFPLNSWPSGMPPSSRQQ